MLIPLIILAILLMPLAGFLLTFLFTVIFGSIVGFLRDCGFFLTLIGVAAFLLALAYLVKI